MSLFSPVRLGALELPNRLVMAPLTRRRCDAAGVPGPLQETYYAQRASMGLLITEGTWPVREGRTWIGQPGLTTPEQAVGWRRVADAVHTAGGRAVVQLMHGGRIAAPATTLTGRTVAPSPIIPPGALPLPGPRIITFTEPHELTTAEITRVIDDFVAAALLAREVGLDGVELHAANGYLLHQFLAPSSNTRTDAYGGSPEGRARLAVEVCTAVAAAIGGERTSVRLSPERGIQGVLEEDPADVAATYATVAAGLAPLGLAFVDVLHREPGGQLVQSIRRDAQAPLVVNIGSAAPTTREQAAQIVDEGWAEAVGVGRAALANPDLAQRWRLGAPENTPDPETFYEGDERGYTDYPRLG